MKKQLIGGVVTSFILVAPIYAKNTLDSTTPVEAKIIADGSYSLAYRMGDELRKKGIQVDNTQFTKGLTDGLTGHPASLTDAQQQKALQNYQQLVSQDMQQHQKVLGDANLKAGQDFLTDNAKKTGVQTLSSGLQYKVMTVGKGAIPKATDTVTVNYEGRLINGTVFDSSYKRNQPATFGVSQVIPGWTEALQKMPVGSTWELYIPAKLAYGTQGTPDGAIPPNSTLIFKVELLSIKK